MFVCLTVDADHRSRSCPGSVSSGGCPLDVWGQMGVYYGPRQHCGCDAWSCAALLYHSDHDPGMFTSILTFMLHSHSVNNCEKQEQKKQPLFKLGLFLFCYIFIAVFCDLELADFFFNPVMWYKSEIQGDSSLYNTMHMSVLHKNSTYTIKLFRLWTFKFVMQDGQQMPWAVLLSHLFLILLTLWLTMTSTHLKIHIIWPFMYIWHTRAIVNRKYILAPGAGIMTALHRNCQDNDILWAKHCKHLLIGLFTLHGYLWHTNALTLSLTF